MWNAAPKAAGTFRRLRKKLTLAVTAYTLTVTPVLKQKLETGAFRRTGLFERDAVAGYLKRLPKRGRP